MEYLHQKLPIEYEPILVAKVLFLSVCQVNKQKLRLCLSKTKEKPCQSPSSAQHEAMAKQYRDIIKQALQEFDSSQTDEVYEALAWTGLQNTVAWNSLSQTERDNINQNVTTFFANNPNCQ